MKKHLVVFSGAGMSAESGIQTFRDNNGLWANYKIEEVATLDSWKRNPELVQDFYNQRRKQIIACNPNKAHFLIKDLEALYRVTVITQNIDDLHERAGSSKVLHLHGNIMQSKSSGPNQEDVYYPIQDWELRRTDLCPEGYPLRPHVVWFGEPVPMYDKAIELITDADILIVIGTSLQVYPAAGIIYYTPQKCRKYVIDPAVDNLQLPLGFVSIAKSAAEGLEFILKTL